MIHRTRTPLSERGAGRLFLLLVVAAVIGVVAVVSRNAPRSGDQGFGGVSLGRGNTADTTIPTAAQDSLNSYWTSELPKVYDREFTKLAGGFQPKTPQSRPFSCGGHRQTYADVRGNAFYCGSGGDDYIAWDAAELIPRLTEQFGSVAPTIVLAHEMGHAIQARADVEAPSVVRELQADCFAGGWTRYAETSTTDAVTLTDGSLDSAVAAILTLRDQPGTAADAQQAHGLGFDRVNAFQTGYEEGAERCARFAQGDVVTTELPFRTATEAQTGGNLPYPDTVRVVSASLDEFWSASLPKVGPGKTFAEPTPRPAEGDTLPDCPGDPEQGGLSQFCAATSSVDWLDAKVRSVHQQIGDLATGAVLSDGWAEAAQNEAGLQTTGRQSALQRDCFTGAWLAHLAQAQSADSQLSPGDFDEALTEIVASSFSQDGRRMDRGGAFERTKSLRTGVFDGLSACLTVAG
jgi:predicted metalloprotease